MGPLPPALSGGRLGSFLDREDAVGDEPVGLAMNGGEQSDTTAADGTFLLTGVDPGTYNVRVRGEQGTLDQPTPATVNVAGSTWVNNVRVVVVLPTGVIRGVVRTRAGTPTERAAA